MGAIDEILATIRRLPLQERLRLIERAANEAAEDTPKPAAVASPEPRLSVDEVLAARLTPPPGVGPVTLQDMDRAIAEGPSDGERASPASLLGLMNDDPDLVDQVCSIAYEARRTAHLRAVDE
ncbi:MAG TPA: hypothetical protein VHB79_20790 [Polyangiaceae bacterium]|nr:hypothetical protein [Polyangiaceae bacterium]